MATSLAEGTGTRAELAARYLAVRGQTERLAAPLAVEDQVVQSMPDASPTKWHRAHTTWFFETFVLMPTLGEAYRRFDDQFTFLFNSYYNAVGSQFSRPDRGKITRPGVEAVGAYRQYVDEQMAALFESGRAIPEDVITLGLNHEQQHQELIVTDLKHMLSFNPLWPSYVEWNDAPDGRGARGGDPGWVAFAEGLAEIGHDGAGFGFDNEGPRHRVFLESFALAERPVTCGEYLAFMEDGGYERPFHWLSDGWRTVRERRWRAPLYWRQVDGAWHVFTLSGLRPVDPAEPACHVSYYEADAYARWAGARLPTEAEWEVAAAAEPITGHFVESQRYHPAPAPDAPGLAQLYGDVWEWTQSSYGAYPGYAPPEGAIGEYNAKFMCGQYVLRGGSCATPASHIRATYRNFFPPDARWQFSGIRLAR